MSERAHRAAEPILRVQGLIKRYGSAVAVEDLSFELFAGEVLTLLGPSGCGKSTTLRMIAGLEEPDAGEIWVRGRLVASPAQRVMVPPEGRNLGLVFQSYAIWPHLSVAENIAYPLRVRRMPRAAITARVDDMLRLVRLEGLGGRMSSELSGGQQQRVALARALAYEPDLLLLDEPLSNLDAVLRKEMRAQLRSLQQRLATTVLYVTHDQEEAMSLSSRIVVMNSGRAEQIAPPGIVYEEPATRFVQDFVGRTIRLRGRVSGMGDATRVRIGAGEIEIAAGGPAPLAEGQQVEVALRPEDVNLERKERAGPNVVAARVVEVAYYGDRREYLVSIDEPEAQLIVVTADKRQDAREGDRIFLAIDTWRAVLWPS
ncbi:MAG TPA: ABC transporter ATP-binding protein [Stellaceae bacterium]|nr:ABC transporter ATP-binding protein [Stellaceae bacterium]